MDYGQLISRSVQITLRNRALWLYGFLLALFGGSSGGNVNFNTQFPTAPGTPAPGANPQVPNIPGLTPDALANLQNIPPSVFATIGIAFLCLVLFFVVIGTIVQNVSRAALIGMVNEIEEGNGTSVGQGWGFGWSRFAWRNFLVTFIVGLVTVLIVVVFAFLVGIAMVGLGISSSGGGANPNQTGGAIVGLVCLSLLCFIPLFLLYAIGVSTTVNLAMRNVVLRDAGVIDSLRAGWGLFRTNIGTVIIFLVIMFILGLVWWLVTSGIALALGLGLSGLPGLVAYAVTQQTWAAFLAAVPGFLVLLVLFAIIGTLWAVFSETIWTLFYRQLPNQPGASGMAIVPATPVE